MLSCPWGRGSQTIVLVEELKAFDVERQREREEKKDMMERNADCLQ